MFGRSKPSCKRNLRGLTRRCSLEPLETRNLLSVVTWTGGGGNDLWSNAANWSSGALPTAADGVIIGSGVTVRSNSDVTITNLTNRGTLVDNSTGSDSLTCTGYLNNYGTIRVNGANDGATINVTGPLGNYGTIELNNSGIYAGGGMFNATGAVIQGQYAGTGSDNWCSLIGNITNQGSIAANQHRLSINSTEDHTGLTFTNSGTLTIDSDAYLAIGQSFDPNTGTIAGDGVLELMHTTATFNANWSPTMTVGVFGADITVNGTLTNTGWLFLAESTIHADVNNQGTLTVVTIKGDHYTAARPSTIDGQLTQAADSIMVIGGESQYYASSPFDMDGYVLGGGNLTVADGLTNNGSIIISNVDSSNKLTVSSGKFANAGTLEYRGGDYNGFIVADMQNSGTIHVTHGFLSINLEGNSTTGFTAVDPSYAFVNTGTIQLDGTECSIGGLASPTALGTSILGTGLLGIGDVTWTLTDWTLPTTPVVLGVRDSTITLTGDSGPSAGTLTIPTSDILALFNSTITANTTVQGVLSGWTASTIVGEVTVASGGALTLGYDALPYPLQYEDCGPPSATPLALTVTGNITNHGEIRLYNTSLGGTLTVTEVLLNASDGAILSRAGLFADDGSTNTLNANIINQGNVNVDTCDLAVNKAPAYSGNVLTNMTHGVIAVNSGQTLTVGGSSVNSSNNAAVTLGAGATIDFAADTVLFQQNSYLAGPSDSTIHFRGSFRANTTNEDDFCMPGTVFFDGAGTESSPQTLSLMQEDEGNVTAGYTSCFAFHTLEIGAGTFVKLVDSEDPSTKAAYAESLVVPTLATLDLNNLPLYSQAAVINGTVLDGAVDVTASLGGYVYLDADRDGVMDSSETGRPNVQVSLYRLADTTYSLVATTKTSAMGDYFFSILAAGTYRIVETRPSDYRNVDAVVGTAGGTVVSANEITGIVLDDGEGATGYFFGEVADTAPAVTVELSTLKPETNETLTATATKSDIDGDPVSLTFTWRVNGVVKRTFTSATALTDTFNLSVAGNGNDGDYVRVTVTPHDGTISGTAVNTTAVVAGSPTITVGTVDPLKGIIRWNAYDANGVRSSTVKIDGVKIRKLYGPYRAASGVNYSAYYGALSVGTHTYTITATDKKGHVSTATGTFDVVAAGPTISRVAVYATRGQIKWNAFDINGVASSSLQIDGLSAGKTYGAGKAASGTNCLAKFGWMGLSLGTHNYTILATDKTGQVSSVSGTFEVTNLGPTITVGSISLSRGRIRWNAYDDNGIASCTLRIAGASSTKVFGPYRGSAGVNYSGKFSSLSAGNHTYTITATDKFGFLTRTTGTIVVPVSSSRTLAALDAVFAAEEWNRIDV